MSRVVHSGGPTPPPPESPSYPADPPDADRYELGGLLGRGGMGVVSVAYDTMLRRDVALKTVPVGSPHAARLVREARLTARLEHPGIVPVYDGGRTPDGTPFYTMRLLRGDSLEEAIRRAPELPTRLGLVRHVRDAALAIAHAHRQRVLHRDLKPANIMVGALGETAVADWGLACLFEEADTVLAVGTVKYSAPEQVAGRPVDQRADVYGLGAILQEVLSGHPPGEDAGLPAGVPPALAAIAARALRPDPGQRYPSAEAFAADLDAWFDGRRVDAHDYGMLELGRLFVRRWRAPLAVAVGAAVLFAATGVIAYVRTAADRDRARVAEAAAVEARAVAEGNLARSLLGEALAAARDDTGPDAEQFALAALQLADLPEARGVLARFGGRPRPTRVAHVAQSCSRSLVDPDGTTTVCPTATRLTLHRDGAPDATIDAVASKLAVSSAGVLYLDRDDVVYTWLPPAPPTALTPEPLRMAHFGAVADGTFRADVPSGFVQIDPHTGVRTARRFCAEDPRAGLGTPGPGRRWWSACAAGNVARHEADDQGVPLPALDPADGVPVLVEADRGGADAFVVGTTHGVLVVYAGDTVRARIVGPPQEPIEAALRGERLAVVSSDGNVRAYALPDGTPLGTFRARDAAVTWNPAGQLVVASGEAVDRWTVPTPDHPPAIDVGAGVAGLAVAPDGRAVAAGLGDGTVVVVDPTDGAVLARLPAAKGVVKDVAWSPAGDQLVALTASEDLAPLWDTHTWQRRGGLPLVRGRRVVWTAWGILSAAYSQAMEAWTPAGGVTEHAPTEFGDLEGDGTVAWGVNAAHRPVRFGVDGSVTELPTELRAYAIAPFAEGAVVTDGLDWEVLDAAGREGPRVPLGLAPALEVATHGDHVAFGHADGAISVWRRDGTLRVLLRAHSGHVGSLAFSPDGAWLYSGGWDGTVRTSSTDGW